MPFLSEMLTAHIRTQKALGVKELLSYKYIINFSFDNFLIQHANDIVSYNWFGIGRIFARPCPKTPRHGFLNSREIKSKEEAQNLLKEILAIDPEGELLLALMIEASHSSVLALKSGVLVVGPGNDGATGGKKSVTFPVTTCIYDKGTVVGSMIARAGIDPEKDGFFEYVTDEESSVSTCVQLREGPLVPGGGAVSYYPPNFSGMTVEHVITPTDDLLAWEKLCGELKGQKGVVACHVGGSIASHAAIHCMLNEIPYLTSPVCSGGYLLAPQQRVLPGFDTKEFGRGIRYAESVSIDVVKKNVEAAIAVLHNAVALRTSKYYSRLLGFSAAMLCRAGAWACLGEARYKTYFKHLEEKRALLSRDSIWSACEPFILGDLVIEMMREAASFPISKVPKSCCGFPWLHCAAVVARLYKAIHSLDEAKVLYSLNEIVHVSHNSGELLSKFTDRMEMAANYPSLFAADRGNIWFDVVTAKMAPTYVKAYKSPLKGMRLSVRADTNGGLLVRLDKNKWRRVNYLANPTEDSDMYKVNQYFQEL